MMYSRGRADFRQTCGKHQQQIRLDFTRNSHDNLRSTSFEVKHALDKTFGVLQPEALEEDISMTLSSSSSEDLSNGVSGEDISMSDTSFDDDGTLARNKFNSTDSDIGYNPSRIFDELKELYSHRYRFSCWW
jgi:hypothetical protein